MHLDVEGAIQIHIANNSLASVTMLPSDFVEQKLTLVSSSAIEMGLDCHLLAPSPLPGSLGVIGY